MAGGQTIAVTGSVDFENVNLQSTVSGTAWKINFSGSDELLTGLKVQDSDASGGFQMVAGIKPSSGSNDIHWALGQDTTVRYWSTPTNGNWTNFNTIGHLSPAEPTGVPPPNKKGIAQFDGRFGNNGSATIDKSISISSLTIPGYVGTITVAPGKTVTLAGSFSQQSGTLNLNNTILTVGGNFDHSGGLFQAGTSTVAFMGAASSLTGSTTFYGFSASTSSLNPNNQLTFQAGTTFYVTNNLSLQGVKMVSSQPGSYWYFPFTGTSQLIQSVSVGDSNAYGGFTLLGDQQSVDLDPGNPLQNWVLGAAVAARYWVGQTDGALWSDSANWSRVSGGTGGADVPTDLSAVFFDQHGKGQVTLPSSALTLSTFTINGFPGTITVISNDLTITNSFLQTSGNVQFGQMTLTFGADLNF